MRNLKDQRFGRLVVLRATSERRRRGIVWLCQCDCGEKTRVLSSELVQGKTRSCGCLARELSAKRLEGKTGDLNHNWRGGRSVNGYGYVLVYAPEHPRAHKGQVKEHILVAERILGEPLPDGFVVHHANGVRDDNSEENIVIFPDQSAHRRYHARLEEIAAHT
jgi:hypothetical protein